MHVMSDDEWFAQLDEPAKDRIRRIVDERSSRSGDRQEALGAARSDAGGKHAQLAFDEFCKYLNADWCLTHPKDDRPRRLQALTEAEGWEEEGDVPPRLARAREGLQRMLAGPASYEDLFAFAWVIAHRQTDRLAQVMFDYSSGAGIGWRLMETWRNEDTGRPLSAMVIARAHDRAAAKARVSIGSAS